MKAEQLLDLLAQRHSRDIFIPECRVAQDYGKAQRRIDALAIDKSWASPRVTGYEIKVSRRDFVQDDKWQQYLEFCNVFYFVTPAGIIKAGEIPQGVGWLQSTRNGTRLYLMQKAPYRKVDIPTDLFKYILFSRADIGPAHRPLKRGAAFWQTWVRRKRRNHTLGVEVSRRVAELYRKNVERVERAQANIDKQLDAYRDVRALVAALGLTTWEARELVLGVRNKLASVIEPSVFWAIRNAQDELDRLEVRLKSLGRIVPV